jgi:hypothetical protein
MRRFLPVLRAYLPINNLTNISTTCSLMKRVSFRCQLPCDGHWIAIDLKAFAERVLQQMSVLPEDVTADGFSVKPDTFPI